MVNKTRKFRVATGTLKLPTEVSTAEDIVILKDPEDASNIRVRLNRLLNLLSVQGVIVGVVVFDALMVTFLLLIELNVIQAPPTEGSRNLMRRSTTNESEESAPPGGHLEEAEHVMHIVELVVLTVFLVEIILRFVARGVDLVYDKWQVFDSLVVVVTFALYTSLTGAVTSRRVTYSVGYLILPRLWRIGRIHYDLTQPVIQKARALIMAHRRAWRETEEQLKLARARTERQREQIEVLKSKLRTVQRHRPASPSNSPSTFSATDTMTSDEEYMTDTVTSTAPFASTTVHMEPSVVHMEPTVVHMESSASYRSLRSQSLPSNPGRYLDTDSSISLPGSPRSIACFHGNSRVLSHGSSGKIPDLVEHTKSADITRDPSFREAFSMQALALDRGSGRLETGLNRTPSRSKSEELLLNCAPLVNGGPKYRKNPYRGVNDRTLAEVHREKSLSTGALEGISISLPPHIHSSHKNTHSGEPQVMTLPRVQKDVSPNHDRHSNSQDAKLYPKDKSDKLQLLIEPGGAHGSDYAFSNPSFSQLLTPEELERHEIEEIQRVSQIPFDQYGSISHLLKEGIPISEL